jgi:transposase InsO family protein
MPRRRKPPSQTWRAFLDNHISDLVSLDFFTVPTATFRVLFVLIILAHDRRKIVHFNVTEHPTAEWTGQQIVEALCESKVPRFLIRDRDGVYGLTFQDRVKALGIEEVVIAPRSPWQNPYSERVIGSLRRECLDYVVVLGEKHLRRIMRCAWRINNCGHNPLLYLFLVTFGMRDLILLFVHILATSIRLARPGGVRSVLAESVLLKHQLMILNRSRRRAPNLRVSDRLIAGLCALLVCQDGWFGWQLW